MTRINSGINVSNLTNIHLLSEHREIIRLVPIFHKSFKSGSINRIPEKFKLGEGHVLFFLDKHAYAFKRYCELYNECIRRGLKVTSYHKNWETIQDNKYYCGYAPSNHDRSIIIERILSNIANSSEDAYFIGETELTKQLTLNHYYFVLISNSDESYKPTSTEIKNLSNITGKILHDCKRLLIATMGDVELALKIISHLPDFATLQ